MFRTQRDNEIKIINFYFPRRVDSIRDDCVCVCVFFLFFFLPRRKMKAFQALYLITRVMEHTSVLIRREKLRGMSSFLLYSYCDLREYRAWLP